MESLFSLNNKKYNRIITNYYKSMDGFFYRLAIERTIVLIKLDENGLDTKERFVVREFKNSN